MAGFRAHGCDSFRRQVRSASRSFLYQVDMPTSRFQPAPHSELWILALPDRPGMDGHSFFVGPEHGNHHCHSQNFASLTVAGSLRER
jgi:hypothetical protein